MWANSAGSWAWRRILGMKTRRGAARSALASRFWLARGSATTLALVAVLVLVTVGVGAHAAPNEATTRAPTTGTATAGVVVSASNTTSAAATANPAATATTTAASSTVSATAGTNAAPEASGPSLKERWGKLWAGAVGLMFGEWPSPLFEANLWNTTLAGLRVILPLLLAGLLLTVWVVERGHGRVPPKLVRQLGLTFTLSGFIVYFGAGNPNVRHPGFYQPAAYYHGYLGQKYRNELAEVSLVECTLAAEKLLGKAQTHAQRYVYLQPDATAPMLASTVAAVTEPKRCSEHFSEARWQSFQADIGWFISALRPNDWADLQRTRAEVTSPAWRMIVSPLVSAPASEARFRTLALIELALHGAALAAVGWALGPVAAALLSVTWGCQPFFAFTQGVTLLGNLWLIAWIVGLCLWRRRTLNGAVSHWTTVGSGASLALATCLQPLAALALLPVLAVAVARLPSRLHGSIRSWGATLVVTLLVVGVLSTRFGSYGRYAEEVALRRATPALSDTGLAAALSNQGTARYRFQRLDNSPEPTVEWTALRGAAHEAKSLKQDVAIAALLALACFVAWRRRGVETAALLGLALVPLVTQPVHQNIGLIAVCLLCARRIDLAVPVLTALAGCVLLANQTVFADDRAAALTIVLWVTTTIVLLASVRPWRPRPLATNESPVAVASLPGNL